MGTITMIGLKDRWSGPPFISLRNTRNSRPIFTLIPIPHEELPISTFTNPYASYHHPQLS